ncbi:hypothetical protein GOEFS_073_00220 [Gordonia effusa NBRC 100432]|uniref:Uncharacterized protein n=1 Tax=Gordonia effusa NBRC 100432 TaxID=1077974 RepID=H0R1Q1_9ACTN|nr:hypothetical protein GOEFS_073_00220 [Gordonia effusa NBRC 100432]
MTVRLPQYDRPGVCRGSQVEFRSHRSTHSLPGVVARSGPTAILPVGKQLRGFGVVHCGCGETWMDRSVSEPRGARESVSSTGFFAEVSSPFGLGVVVKRPARALPALE